MFMLLVMGLSLLHTHLLGVLQSGVVVVRLEAGGEALTDVSGGGDEMLSQHELGS